MSLDEKMDFILGKYAAAFKNLANAGLPRVRGMNQLKGDLAEIENYCKLRGLDYKTYKLDYIKRIMGSLGDLSDG